MNRQRASEEDRQWERVRDRAWRQSCSEERREAERERGRHRRQNCSEDCRQAERERPRINRQRQREREFRGGENGSKITTCLQKVSAQVDHSVGVVVVIDL